MTRYSGWTPPSKECRDAQTRLAIAKSWEAQLVAPTVIGVGVFVAAVCILAQGRAELFPATTVLLVVVIAMAFRRDAIAFAIEESALAQGCDPDPGAPRPWRRGRGDRARR